MATPVPIKIGNYGSNSIEVESIEVLSEDKAIVNGRVAIDSGLVSFEGKDLDWFKNSIVVFEGEPVFGISITEVPSEAAMIVDKFQNEFVYEIQVKTIMDPQTKINEKLKKDLVRDKKLLDELIEEADIKKGCIEFYCCWADEEHLPRNRELDKKISYEGYCKADYIKLEEKQYIKVEI